MLNDAEMDDLRWKADLIGGCVPVRPEELREENFAGRETGELGRFGFSENASVDVTSDDLDLLFLRDHHIKDLILHTERLDALFQVADHRILVSRVGVDRIPVPSMRNHFRSYFFLLIHNVPM